MVLLPQSGFNLCKPLFMIWLDLRAQGRLLSALGFIALF